MFKVNEIIDELRAFTVGSNIDVDVTPSDNRIVLVNKTSGKTLTIICSEHEHFHLAENVGNHRNGVQSQVSVELARHSPSGPPLTRSKMIAEAKRWIIVK
jgi:ribosomal protein L21E